MNIDVICKFNYLEEVVQQLGHVVGGLVGEAAGGELHLLLFPRLASTAIFEAGYYVGQARDSMQLAAGPGGMQGGRSGIRADNAGIIGPGHSDIYSIQSRTLLRSPTSIINYLFSRPLLHQR